LGITTGLLTIGGALWLLRAPGSDATGDLRQAIARVEAHCDVRALQRLLRDPPFGELLDRIAGVAADLNAHARGHLVAELSARRAEAVDLWRREPERRRPRVAAFALVLHYDADVLIDLHAAGDADDEPVVRLAAYRAVRH